MTTPKEIETLWKFIRGCVCNDVTSGLAEGQSIFTPQHMQGTVGQLILPCSLGVDLASPGSGVGSLLPPTCITLRAVTFLT